MKLLTDYQNSWRSLFYWTIHRLNVAVVHVMTDGAVTAAYLDVVEDGRGDVGVQVDESFLLQQLWQRAADQNQNTGDLSSLLLINQH